MTNQDELNKIQNKVINDYRAKAELRFAEYDTGRTEHCAYAQQYMPNPPASILDIGSGSGRDAAYYAEQGYLVTAIEPANELLELAKQKYGHLNINWIDDRLPELNKVRSKEGLFDHVHMHAVIFHLPKESTKEILSTVFDLLKENGTFYVGIRNGPTDPERPMFDVNKEHVISKAENIFELIDTAYAPSKSRPEISWDWLVFKKTHDKY